MPPYAPSTLVFLHGFGGVKVDGKLCWPARVVEPDEGGEKVQKAKKPDRILSKKVPRPIA